ncbi:(Fe-S)-binding protein [Actinomadura sp. DC4]|uniref:(Fe-S)-binding protein n=1 Tax=Actinomadura sp. DC4 TaxID=3055069 RepID=UPI0025B1A9DA|nr:(Fe-S)-binding protein [Actinomadura sp. DC4]MDN3359469.1 (Fe-S)-binding protein [Actinomadura sp. DC4]
MRIAVFVTCWGDALFPATGRAVVGLLEHLGHEVTFEAAQTCCGQLHWTTGYHPEATALARRFAEIFRGHDVVVTPSASCAATVRTAYPRMDPALAGLPVCELSELLIDVLGVTDVGASYPHRVTYQPTCQSLRALGVGDRPLRLLRAVRDLELAELPDAGECCGFGGAFAMKNADMSVAMVADTIARIHETGADVVCATDDSCLTHIGGALSRLRSGVRAVHLAEILASGLGTGERADIPAAFRSSDIAPRTDVP